MRTLRWLISSAVALILAWAAPAWAQDSAHVVIVATTDVHGRVYHWDYVQDREAPWGLTRAATVIDSLRRSYPGRVVVVDAGDLIQGDPFATFFARERPLDPHPIIDAMNALQYDAATPGNHEFNWGLDVLDRVVTAAGFALVSGNVYRVHPPGERVFAPFTILEKGRVRVGVTGFTTPGVMVWDRDHVTGRLVVRPIVPDAAAILPAMTDAGADLRVAVVHSGMDRPSSYDTTGVGAENVAARLATLPVAPHVVVVGHSHRSMVDSVIGAVHFIQPEPHARSLAVAHVWLKQAVGRSGGQAVRWEVVRIRGEQIPLADVPPDPIVTRRLASAHQGVQVWVNQPLSRLEGDWSVRYARVEDTPAIDFVNHVQRRATDAQLASTAAFNPNAVLGPHEVRLRDLAGLYPYENTLKVIRISGAQLKAYLEQSAAYFRTYIAGLVEINDSIPGYDFDIVSGVDYVIDLTFPVGARIRQLTYRGELVRPEDEFTLALNSYRQSGGGGFTMLVDAPVMYDRRENIRDLLAEHVRPLEVLRASDYFTPSWQIVPPEAAEAARAAFAHGVAR